MCTKGRGNEEGGKKKGITSTELEEALFLKSIAGGNPLEVNNINVVCIAFEALMICRCCNVVAKRPLTLRSVSIEV